MSANKKISMAVETGASTLGWDQLATLVGSSAIISGLVSAAVNFIFTMKEKEKERQVAVIQDILNLYSIVIYHLDRLLDLGQSAFLQDQEEEVQIQKEEQLNETIRTIDSEIQKKFYLIDYEAVLYWTHIKREYNVRDVDNPTAKKIWNSKLNNKGVRGSLIDLRKLLVSKYNNNISAEFESITRKHIPRIPDYDVEK